MPPKTNKKTCSKPPQGPVWWFSSNPRTGAISYTKTRSWFEARSALGGEPVRVTDPDTLANLDGSLP